MGNNFKEVNKPLSDKGLKQKEYIVTTSELCEILGLSPRRIQQLTKEDALIRSSRGKYDLAASIKAYIEYAAETPEEELSKTEEETLWTRARRQKAELELKIMNGQVHRSEDVEQVMNEMLSSFRAQMLVIPGKVAPKVIGITEVEVIKTVIKNAVYEALQELSDYDPDVFYAKSRDKLSVDDEEIGEEKIGIAEKEPQKNAKSRKQSNK